MVSAATKLKVQQIIDENPVGTLDGGWRMADGMMGVEWSGVDADRGPIIAVFSKSYCPHCGASKKTLTELGAKFFVLELDQIGMCWLHPTPHAGCWLMRDEQVMEPRSRRRSPS